MCSPRVSFAQGIGTEFLAQREKIEVTRHHSTCELSLVPMGRAHRPHAGYFGVLSESVPEIGTRWRSGMNSNPQYRLSGL